MGSLDCCQRGVKNELVIETDPEHIQDKEGFPQDTDPAFRSKKIEVENSNENLAENQGEEILNQEKNDIVMEVGESGLKEIEKNETNDNNEANVDMNIPNTDNNVVQENIAEVKEYNSDNNENNVLENAQNVENAENAGNEGFDNNNNIVQGELNIDQYFNNYNQQQVQGNQNGEIEEEEDYNKYFEQNPDQQNNNDIDINQYFTNNQTNQINTSDLSPVFTFAENQADANNLISSNNAQTSQEYNYEYNYNIPNA